MTEKIIYNKLVRDKLSEIIEASGKTRETRILSEKEYLQIFNKKSDEELADLLEVLYATARARGYSIEELDHVCIKKQKNMVDLIKKFY